MRSTNEFKKVRVYTCPSYPDKRQLICYVDNAGVYSLTDQVGYELNGLSKINRIRRPTDTVYMADNEFGSWRPIITDLNVIGSDELNDVWSPDHLPYSANGRVINQERKVALARHGQSVALLYFDGHAGAKKSKFLITDDWRKSDSVNVWLQLTARLKLLYYPANESSGAVQWFGGIFIHI